MIKILPIKIVGKYHFPWDMKAHYDWKALEIGTKQNTLAKYVIAKYISVADWMELVILTMLGIRYEGLKGWDHSIKVMLATVRCHSFYT